MTVQDNYNRVFTDYLSVSFAPDDCPITELTTFFCSCGYQLDKYSSGILKFTSDVDPMRGQCSIAQSKRFVLVKVSGKALQYLRYLNQFQTLLATFSGAPHRVTRLDATIDISRDFPSVMRSLDRKYPSEQVLLGSKRLKVTKMLSRRNSDGKRSGTYYIGHHRNQVSCAIYDKTLEMAERAKVVIPTTTRYEIRFKSTVKMSLKDAYDPTSLFWAYGEALLLKKPKNVPEWVSGGEFIGWEHVHEKPLPYSVLNRSIDYSSDLASWLVLARDIGSGGHDVLTRLLVQAIESDKKKFQVELGRL